ncbi:hypothetical protein HHA03_05140 [Halolactibacillus halophilus]|uniref:Uncharacterized protein n=1 Tax=Halolactibacillus halophilus TaxID=306540 RepID=A0ABQ0VIH3_9BACI|nr:hypothetical protein HHA03_05140 [Halolactibacillus halophilus]
MSANYYLYSGKQSARRLLASSFITLSSLSTNEMILAYVIINKTVKLILTLKVHQKDTPHIGRALQIIYIVGNDQ